METCDICKKQIDATQEITQRGDKYVHATCVNKTKTALRIDDSQKKGSKRGIKTTGSVITKTTGSVITEVDISWSNAFWLAFQFIVVLNILMIPIALIYLMIFNILY